MINVSSFFYSNELWYFIKLAKIILRGDVVYWPTTRLDCQNRKCTCVNNRYIRSRNNQDIIALTVDGLNECNLWRPQEEGDVELLYNSVKTGSQLVWRPDPLVTRCGRESQHPAEWAPRLPVEQPRRTGKKHGYGQ